MVTRWSSRGTHRGEFRGIAPTGNEVRLTGIGIFRFSEGGKVVESWDNFDQLGMLQQLGAIPSSGREEARAAAEGEQEEKGLLDKARDKLTGQ